jgi:outer membrane protein TolC
MRNLLLSLTLVVGGFAFGQKLSLKQAIALALASNHDILIEQNHQLQSETRLTRGNAGMWPSAQVNSGITLSNNAINQRFANGLEITNPAAQTANVSAGVGINWVLFDGGRIRLAYQNLKQEDILARLQLKATIQETVAEVIKNYNQLIILDLQTRSINKALELSELKLKVAQRNSEIGKGSRVELLQSLIEVNSLRSQFIKLNQSKSLALTRLATLTGSKQSIEIETNQEDILPAIPALPEIINRLSKSNPALVRLNEQCKLAENNWKISRSDKLPQLTWLGNYNFSRNNSNAGFALFNQTSGPLTGLQLSVPLYDGKQIQNRIKVADLQRKNADLELNKESFRIENEVKELHQRLELQIELTRMANESKAWAEEYQSIAVMRYETGTIDYTLVLDAQRNFVDALNQWQTAEQELLNLKVELLLKAGLIWE